LCVFQPYGAYYLWGVPATNGTIVFFRRRSTGPTYDVITATLLKTANVTRKDTTTEYLPVAAWIKAASRSGGSAGGATNYGA